MLGQLKLAQILNSISFFAALLLSSNSFAQANCQNRDCIFPLAAQGLQDPLRGLASESRDPRFQQAVGWQVGPKPVYQYDDTTGRTTCVWNCPQEGETGQPRMHKVAVMGADERRNAYLNADEQVKYSNVGRIECPSDVAGKVDMATGWITTTGDTMATVAHAFVNPRTHQKVNPATCKFVMYSASGRLLDIIDIRYAKSGWDNLANFRDRSFDYACVKLARAPRHSIEWPDARKARGFNDREVSLVSYHGDLTENLEAARITRGKANFMAANGVITLPNSRYRATDRSRFFQTTYDSNHGSSGGMIVDKQTGIVIGMHVGSSEAAVNGAPYNSRTNFNYGIYFDDAFMNMLGTVANDRSGGSI